MLWQRRGQFVLDTEQKPRGKALARIEALLTYGRTL